MKIICFTIVATTGLCISIVPLFKVKSGDDVVEATFAVSILLMAVFLVVGIFGALLFA